MPAPQSLAESFAALGFTVVRGGERSGALCRAYEDGTAHYVIKHQGWAPPSAWDDLCDVVLTDAQYQPLADEVCGITAEDVILLFRNGHPF